MVGATQVQSMYKDVKSRFGVGDGFVLELHGL